MYSVAKNERLVLSSAELNKKKYITYFLIWKGGMGVFPRKILNTKKAGEAISGHFVRTILPSVNEQFQRVLFPFIVGSFLNIKGIYTNIHFVCISLAV